VRYEHDKAITDGVSAICSSRVIWGGDGTIAEIRKSPLPPRANEVTFPDRFSICLVDAGKYLAEYDKAQTARDFYNDTYLNDQNACTAPRIVFWFGTERERAKSVFWGALHERLGAYELQPAQTVDKLSTFCRFAADSECRLAAQGGYKVMRVAVKELGRHILDNLGNSGYFYEYDAESLDEVLPICTRKCQTLSYIGFEARELRDFILARAPHGVDRIVPVGKTMNFALVWDGIDLIRTLSRKLAATQYN
jgi:hypothetical protein